MHKRQPRRERLRMTELILVSIIAALYVLGRYQGSCIADVISSKAPAGMEIDPKSRAFLEWGWPIATLVAMTGEDEE